MKYIFKVKWDITNVKKKFIVDDYFFEIKKKKKEV